MVVARTQVWQQGRARDLPVLYYMSMERWPMVYPLTRQMIGTLWSTASEVSSFSFGVVKRRPRALFIQTTRCAR